MNKINVFWFRRDLRLHDNRGLYEACERGLPVLLLFIFDTDILSKLENRCDARIDFIHQNLLSIHETLKKHGSSLYVGHGKPAAVWDKLSREFNISEVFCNTDYEPYAIGRDLAVKNLLESRNIGFRPYKDHVIMGPEEVLKDDGKPYTVFTPYSRKWRSKLNADSFKAYPSEKALHLAHQWTGNNIPTLNGLGFENSGFVFPPSEVKAGLIKAYAEKRNFPALDACSHLGIHFRFGTISVREKAGKAVSISDTWVNELIWRDFYVQIMAHFPHAMTSAFKPEYMRIAWRNNQSEFDAWCKGKTGYPIVDAGMRELNATGYMHNRVRMITASFLCKHLLIDWRWGEAYFAEKLLDFDLASNNGGWQWAAGSGVDAAPYFRVFNPSLQTEKFDSGFDYIKRWLPEFGTKSYPAPIVEHSFARQRCLLTYKQALKP